MINLMYLVFIAMLALNVSVEVLNGFDVVKESLNSSSDNLHYRNQLILSELERHNSQNREKAGEWYDKAQLTQSMSDSLIAYIEALKIEMVKTADGKKADINRIKNKENLDAASIVMLTSPRNEGRQLRQHIDNYRQTVSQLIADPQREKLIEHNLNTDTIRIEGSTRKNWEHSLFDKMPVAAAVTLLTKLQNDIRLSEGEALSSLLSSVDVGDFRVNKINAHVIPESRIVFRGGSYNARIALSAEDTTRRHHIVVNGKPTDGTGHYRINAGSTGTFPIEGYIEMTTGDGTVVQKPFSDSYTVIEPTATIAPTLMNVLYAGIDNEISISAPGVTPQELSATMTNGTLTRKGNLWVARPNKVGESVSITLSATTGGQTNRLSTQEFRVRALPDPTPYIEYRDAQGNLATFKGGTLSKAVLMETSGILAAIDDGILNIPFRVTSFRTNFFDSMGNVIPEVSDGSRFSERQKEQIRRLQRGRYFYISDVRAIGPDGTEREIAVIEVRIG